MNRIIPANHVACFVPIRTARNSQFHDAETGALRNRESASQTQDRVDRDRSKAGRSAEGATKRQLRLSAAPWLGDGAWGR